MNGCWLGHEFWIELKCSSSQTVSLSPFQVAWHMRRAASGGRSWILVACSKQKALHLYRGNDAIQLKDHGLSSLPASLYEPPIDWTQFLTDLCLTHSVID